MILRGGGVNELINKNLEHALAVEIVASNQRESHEEFVTDKLRMSEFQDRALQDLIDQSQGLGID
ncbi:MAG: hypothetical protein A2X74_05460 [Polynucleobacter sp. GWA2_45_21]|nr:MAG: hypothetical protein A2X74_05460 [Polynucleobacter sp. GWA2_45_21]HBK42841.1 hypothetical protein [Polynucleobacter sp.]